MKKTEKIYYDNATQNQRQFIENRIRENVVLASCLAGKLLEKEILSYDEIENLYTKEDSENPQEVFEWWIITDDYVLEKLREIGEPVIESDELYMNFWGRTCTGQSIVLDPTFWEVYQDALEYNK